MKKALIVSASKFNDESLLFDDSYLKVAVDNGYHHFYKNKIYADYLIGDFDTLIDDDFKYAKEVIRLNPVKDDIDSLYAVKFLLEKGYSTFHFLGCLGGRVDMTLASFSLLEYLLNLNKEAIMYSDDEEVYLINSRKDFSSSEQGRISFLAMKDNSLVSIKNFKYEYDGYLRTSFPLGVSNQFISKDCFIDVKEGIIAVIKEKNKKN